MTVFFGSLTVAFLRQGLGGVTSAGPGTYTAVAAVLVCTALAASRNAALEAVRIEPLAAVE